KLPTAATPRARRCARQKEYQPAVSLPCFRQIVVQTASFSVEPHTDPTHQNRSKPLFCKFHLRNLIEFGAPPTGETRGRYRTESAIPNRFNLRNIGARYFTSRFLLARRPNPSGA